MEKVVYNENGIGVEGLSPWPLYTGRGTEPTPEECAKSMRALSNEEVKCLLQRAGILDEDGGLTSRYRY
jgi:hypothetical protein